MSVNIKQNGDLVKIANNTSIVQADWNDREETTKSSHIKNQPATLKTLEEIAANVDENALTGANAVKELNDSLTTKTYNHISQLGITSWHIPDIINAMPANSRFCCDSGQGLRDDERNKLPLNLGVLTIDKPTNSRYRVMFNYSAQASKGQLYIASVDIPNLVVNEWYEIGNFLYSRDNVVPDGTNCTLQGTGNYLFVEKSGKQVNMYGRVYFPNELNTNKWYTIGQIPEGYYPKYTHSNTLFSAYGTSTISVIECTISDTGVIQIRAQMTKPKGWFPVASMSWFTD